MGNSNKGSITIPHRSPVELKSRQCEHNYLIIDSDVKIRYADGDPYITKVDAVMYCSKCLEIQSINKVVECEGND